jgi:hypothetical protein
VDLLRELARTVPGTHLGVLDGGSALRTVVRPLVVPEEGQPRIEFLTRLPRIGPGNRATVSIYSTLLDHPNGM